MDIVLAFLCVFALLFLGFPVALGLALVGFVGTALIIGWDPSLSLLAPVVFENMRNYEFAVLPLFILMGNLIKEGRLSDDLYEASYAFLGHKRGGLAMATVVACGGFSAVCGSSLATASTMTRVAMPPMLQYGYAQSLAAGCIAAGGTLGILIPPSVVLLVYGILTDTNIGALFVAGVIPGLLGILGYVGAVWVTTAIDPKAGPAGARVNWAGRLRAIGRVWAVLLLFLLVIGGLYLGWFTANEAAGIGAFGALVIALFRRALTWRSFHRVFIDSVRTSAMMLFLLVGALLFNNYLDLAGFTTIIRDFVTGLDVHPYVVVTVILLIYLVLGCLMESLSMMLLTVPIFFPIVTALDFGMPPDDVAVWFGIIVVVIIEIGLITPPIGLNVFVISSLVPNLSPMTAFRGVTPFIIADFIRLALLTAFPIITLFLAQAIK